jgi:hypothetical protein
VDFSWRHFFRRLLPYTRPFSSATSLKHQPRHARRAYLPELEPLEERTTPTTSISFDTTSHILTLNVGASSETAALSVSGTTLSVTSNSLIGTIADLNAVTVLGFLPATPTGVANTGNIGSANDVREIIVTGADGTQAVDFQGGTFPAVTAIDGLIGAVIFDTAPSVFAQISPNAPNANLNVSTANLTISQTLTTQNNGNISLTDNGATETIAAAVTAGGSGTVTLAATGGTSDVVIDATVSSSSGSLSATAGQNVTLNAGSLSTAGTITLAAGAGAVSEGGAGTITGALLTTNSATGAANDGAAGVVQFRDGLAFTIGTETGLGLFGGATGVTSTNGDITLCGAGITIDQVINAGTADVRLTSMAGISQNASGVITGTNLGVLAAGPVLLDQATNQVSGILATNDSGAGSPIQFLDGAGLTIGSEAALSCFTGASGVTTSDGNIVLNSPNLTFNAAVGAGTATVALTSGSTVSQSAAGVITAGTLGTNGAGAITLDAAANQVSGTFAAENTPSAGAVIQFQDGVGFTVGTVGSIGLFNTTTGVMTTNGNITLCGLALTLTSAVNAGTADVRLTSLGGITQNGAGVITGANLGLIAAGPITLDGATNQVTGNLAANDTGAGAALRFLDGAGLTIASEGALSCFAGATGLATNNGDIVLNAPTLTVNAAVNAGTRTVGLTSGGGGRPECGRNCNRR